MNIRGLAEHLNLSIGTVSRALNHRRDVNPETRRRVIEAALALGYTPNQSGRALRRGRTGTVAFILPLTTDSGTYGDPFFMAVLEGIQAALEREGLELVVLPVRRDQDQVEHLRRHLGRGTADAWLLVEIKREDERIALLERQRVPFATFGRSLTQGHQPWIDLDFEQVTGIAIGRFTASGHRRIALIVPGDDVNFSEIVIGSYCSALEMAGLTVDPQLIYQGPVDSAASAGATARLLALREPPSAIFVVSENGPVGVYAALRAAGLEPGRDVSVIGSRETAASALLDPPLTCFSLDLQRLGEAFANMLVRSMKDEVGEAGDRSVLWPFETIEGRSDHPRIA